jgi:hypothetical protein
VAPDPGWQADTDAALAWRRWDDEYVIHHALSNDTHRVAELPGLLLVRMNQQPLRTWTRQELADACDAEPEAVDDAMAELLRFGFVRPC